MILGIGRSAPEEFISMVESLANEHHSSITVDCTRAYFYGSRFNVEIEIVMPEHTLLKVSHDIALDLQHKLENLPEVERAFVHVDYLHRDMPEHKVERNLLLGYAEGTESTLLLERAQSAGSTFPSAA
jgi:divalent metal cation (Fe/Co/Zn/Cd) transporter